MNTVKFSVEFTVNANNLTGAFTLNVYGGS